MLARMSNRRCDTCGDFTFCYAGAGRLYFDGWRCGRCMLAWCVPQNLVYALNVTVGIARWEPEAAEELLLALLKKADGQLAKDMLSDMACRIEAVAEHGDATTEENVEGWADKVRAEMSDGARAVNIEHTFPSDVETAYEEGRKSRPNHDGAESALHPDEFGWSEVYKPRKLRTFNAPDEQRWAVNHLRHGRSNYEKICTKLQKEARKMLKQNGRTADPREESVINETIHQIIKNRVLEEIAVRFPELAEAAREQKV